MSNYMMNFCCFRWPTTSPITLFLTSFFYIYNIYSTCTV